MQQDGETGSGSDDTILKKPVLTTLAAVGFLALMGSLVAATTIGPGRVTTDTVNTTGTQISFNDNLTLNDNNMTGGEIVEVDQFTTVHNTSLKAIDEAIDKYNYVKLRPTNYSGDHTISINSSNRDIVYLDGEGATIQYNGDSQAFRIANERNVNAKPPVFLSVGWMNARSGDPSTTNISGFKIYDQSNVHVDVGRFNGFDYQVFAEADERWVESLTVDLDNTFGALNNVRMKGNDGSSDNRSFRNLDLRIDNADSAWSNASYLIYITEATVYEANIDVEGFAQGNSNTGKTTGMFLNGTLSASVIERFDIEGDGHGIEFGKSYDPGSGLWLNHNFANLNGKKYIKDPGNEVDFTSIQDSARDSGDWNPIKVVRHTNETEEPIFKTVNGSIRSEVGTNGSFKNFLELADHDGTTRLTIDNGNNVRFNTPEGQNYAFLNDDTNVMTLDDDGIFMPNGPIDLNSHNITRAQ